MFVFIVAFLFHCYFVVTIDIICSQREYKFTDLKRRCIMCRLIKRILGYLIPARAIVGVPLREVEYGDGHQLADEDLFIGADTKAFMRSAELPVSAEKKIFQ